MSEQNERDIPVMSQFLDKYDCFKAREKWFQSKINELEKQIKLDDEIESHEINQLKLQAESLQAQLTETERDRDEWKDSTVSANQRFKYAERKNDELKDQLNVAVEALGDIAGNLPFSDEMILKAIEALNTINKMKGE